ncbi:MAG: choice-of-anchor tandem repeat GloVer-containing protein [Candidatus Cybelea sp.]
MDLSRGRNTLSSCVAVAMLAGCGGSQPPIGVPGAIPQTSAIALYADRNASSILAEARVNYRVRYSFTGDPDGAGPGAGLLALNGRLYGTTSSGGANNDGTVFAITQQGTETVLYSFTGGTDGSDPGASLIDVNGTLYGTTELGGTANSGTVFAVTTSGKEKALHSFGGSGDGATPVASLLDVKGTLYGTTRNGGANCSSGDCGTVFKITKSGKETVLHSFGGSGDGATPVAALINVKGKLYGTSLKGGVTSSHSCTYTRFDSSCGTVFSITTSGVENVLYRFAGIPNAQNPAAALTNVNGKLYGTTEFGGTSCGPPHCGTVFSITTSGKEKILYSFGSDGSYGVDGLEPLAGLIVVNGDLYGTTFYGGTNCYSSIYCGTIFKVTTSGKETVIYDFCSKGRYYGCFDGEGPQAGLINVGGTLYGTTTGGASKGDGVVFSLRP